jgi:hypothetical protein
LIVSFADFFDFRFFGASEVAEIVKECLRLARCEGFADERSEVLAIAYGGG